MSEINRKREKSVAQKKKKKLTWEDGTGKSNHFAWFTDVEMGILFLLKSCKDLITWKVLDG